MSFKTKLIEKIKAWFKKQFGGPDAPQTTTQDNPKQPDTTSGPSAPVTESGFPADVLPWDTIHWAGQNNASKAVVTKLLRSVKIYGDMDVRLDFDTNKNWPRICKAVSDCHSSFMVFTTAIDGALRGGHIDHMRPDAKQRDLGNLYNGYILQGVPRGKDIYVAIASHDGKERSNLVKAERPVVKLKDNRGNKIKI